MSKASNDKLDQAVGSRYALVIAVAKRAKQLREGSPRLVDSKSRNHITVALEEVAAGVVTVRVPTPEELEVAERLERVTKPTTAAREAQELLRRAEQEALLIAEEAPAETAPTSGIAGILEIEDEEEYEDALASPEATDETEEAEEEETPAEENEE